MSTKSERKPKGDAITDSVVGKKKAPTPLPMAEVPVATGPIDMRLSNSKLKTWRRCPKQFHFKYVEKWKPKGKRLPLERGSWLHSLIETHYEGGDWREEQEKQVEKFDKLFVEEKDDLGDLPGDTLRMFTNYLAHWKDEDSRLKTIATELDEIVELPNGLRFQIIIDWVVEDTRDGTIWLADHKTVKTFMDADYMLLDAQLARYFWGAKQLGFKNLAGVFFNEIRTKPPTVPRVLKSGRLSEAKNIDTDVYTYMKAVKDLGVPLADYRDILLRLKHDTDKWFRRSKMPINKVLTDQLMKELVMGAREIERAQATDQFPRSMDKGCVWGCDFLEPCITELQGGDPEFILKAKYEQNKKD